MMIDGVIRLGPSQETPPNGFENVAAPIDAFHGPEPDGSDTFHRPWSSVLADPTFLPVESFSSTVTPDRPFSPGSTLPGVPPPGLKSRHTVPLMPLESDLAATASFAPDGTSSGGIAVRPIRATEPLRSGVLSVIPVCGSPMTVTVDGTASDSGPPGFQVSWNT